MPLIAYTPKRFNRTSEIVIRQANEIIVTYRKQGFILTLRQLYYQFVSRDYLKNNLQNYKRLGSIINDARLAGRLDWNAIEDRTRNLIEQPHWNSPANILEAAVNSYPPPNPAKITDSRFEGYVKRFGRESWELDALEPRLIVELIEKTVLSLRDDDKWNAAVKKQEAGRARLRKMVDAERNRGNGQK